MVHPELYHVGPAGDLFNSPVFLGWILEGLWGAVVCFFVPLYVFSGPDMDGKILGMWGEGTAIMTCVIMTVTARISVETRFWTWIHVLSYGLSLASWFAFVAVLSIITYPGSDSGSGDSSSYGLNYMVSCQAVYWMLGFTATGISLGPRFIYESFSKAVNPSTEYIVRMSLDTEEKEELMKEDNQSAEEDCESPAPADESARRPTAPTPASMLSRSTSYSTRSPLAGSTGLLRRRTTMRAVAQGFEVPSARMTLDMTCTCEGLCAEDDPEQGQRIQRLLKTASVARVGKRWARNFRARKARREAEARSEDPTVTM